tara:strand:- start:7596 stop:8831 length:1236 start_codon:yes stop_codon:yes gene_type:complete
LKVYFDTCEQQIPLYLRLDTRHLWPEIQQALGLDHKKHAPIAAAIYENSLAGSATSYSRRNVPARNGDCNGILTRKNIIGCVDRLEQLGFVENMVQCPGGRGWRSAARGNNALALLMQTIIPDTGSIPFVMPQRAAIIRDADGQEIPPTNRAAFERIEKPIWAVNEMLQGTDIRDGKGFDIRTPMRRVFNRDTHHGGRLYGMGSIGWQNIPRDERHDTTINGEPTIELDFKAIHPHILYSERGHPIPSDCYDVGNWPRDLVKLALLVLINAETLGEVVTVLANSDGEKITRDEEGGIIDVTTERRLMKQIAGNDYSKAMAFAHKLVQDVKDHHAPIADDFHTGAGIRLMNKDSEIAMHVLTSLTKMGEPVLAVHDSFLVRSSVKDKLEEVMHHAAAKAGLMNIKIEAKTRH